MSLDTAALGQKIKATRKSKGLTQQALSELIDCSPTYISYIESGHKTMSLETLVNITNALGTSTDILLADSLDSNISASNGASDIMSGCSNTERRILMDILLACKQALRRNRRLK